MVFKKHIANCITSIRILGAVALIFLPPLSKSFYLVYTFTGLSDGIDGFIARKLNTTSEFGSKLDSVADLCFYTVMMVKIIPELIKQLWLFNWVFLFVVLAVRISAYLISAIRYKHFSSMHTILNKATGFGVFILPFFFLFNSIAVFNIYSLLLCFVGFLASLQELIFYIKRDC